MTSDPDTVGPDTSIQEAARRIHQTGHNRLPVVEDRGRRADLLEVERIRHRDDVVRVRPEPVPTPQDIERHTYAPSPVDAVYPGDYTGLPQ